MEASKVVEWQYKPLLHNKWILLLALFTIIGTGILTHNSIAIAVVSGIFILLGNCMFYKCKVER